MVSDRRHAFSLIELSILIVIIGLLVGGVLAGRSLMRASELRSVTTSVSNYQIAAKQFKDKYSAIPGDMPTAHNIWGTSCSTLAANCNGNGNALIRGSSESILFWQHLSLAGFIEGRYLGTNNGTVGIVDQVLGVHIPKLQLTNAAASVFEGITLNTGCFQSLMGGATFPGNDCQVPYAIVVSGPAVEMVPLAYGGGIISAEDAWGIDTKMDDGKPGSGKVRGTRNNVFSLTGCFDGASNTYILTDTTVPCLMAFMP